MELKIKKPDFLIFDQVSHSQKRAWSIFTGSPSEHIWRFPAWLDLEIVLGEPFSAIIP